MNLDRASDQETKEITTNGWARHSTENTKRIVANCDASPSKKEKVPVADMQSVCRPVSVKLVRCDDVNADFSPEDNMTTPPRRYPKRNRGPPPMYKYEQSAAKVVRPRKTKPSESDYFDSWSNCIVAYRYDMEKNFFPEPGPSTVNYYVGVDLPGYYTKSLKRTNSRLRKYADASAGGSSSDSEINRTPTPKPKKRGRKPKTAYKRLLDSPDRKSNAWSSSIENTPHNFKSTTETIKDDECDDIMTKSFYVDSPSLFNNTLIGSPLLNSVASPLPSSLKRTNEIEDPLLAPAISKFMECISEATRIDSPSPEDGVLTRIKATESAPSRMEVTMALDANEFPQVVNKRPFYSNPKDIVHSNRTEVGHTVLQLGGAAINDCEPFSSHLNIVGLNSWRKLTISNVIYPIGKKQSAQQQSIESSRELLASDKLITIVPHEMPPLLSEANKWIRTRNRMVQDKNVPSTKVNGNGYHVNDQETIVIDDDSEPDVIMINGHDDSEKTVTNGNSQSMLNGCNGKSKTEHLDDVICLDDSDDDGKIGNHFKISIISSPSTGPLKDEFKKLAKEVGTVSTKRNFS